MINHSPSCHGRSMRERGVSLLFALLALVSLSLAGVALVRSVDTSALVMGNLGFKQDATAAADKATQAAIATVFGPASAVDRNVNNEAVGYYAIAHESIDATGQRTSEASRELINWDLNSCAYATNTAMATCLVRPSDEIEFNGNKMRYVVFRLCSATGAPGNAGNVCARPKTVEGGSEGTDTGPAAAPKRGEIKTGSGKRLIPPGTVPGGAYQGVYYRIVVRVIGARNTTSFVETIVHQ